MRRYEKTTLKWNWFHPGLNTDIPVTDWPDPEKSYFHTVAGFEAIALPYRNGQITIDFRRVSITPHEPERAIICDRLEAELAQYRTKSESFHRLCVTSGRLNFEKFVIALGLRDGHHFCETIVPLVGHILDIFHVEDPNKYRLTEFELTRQTMIQFEESWISYENWLRIRNRLPVIHA